MGLISMQKGAHGHTSPESMASDLATSSLSSRSFVLMEARSQNSHVRLPKRHM